MVDAFSFKNINVTLGKTHVLIDVNITVAENEFLGIIGPNGGGKTTFLKVLLGLIKPNSGEVKIFNSPRRVNQKLLGYVPQYSNFPASYPISIKEVVEIGALANKQITGKEKSILVDEALDKVNLLNLSDSIVTEISGGEKQRVLIARALTSKPKILLLDEPTASIDIASGNSFYDLMSNLNKNMTIVLVSHDIGAVSQYVKKIACLNKKLVFHNSKEISEEMLESTYNCPVDLIAHGVPHRVLHNHDGGH